MVSDGVAAVVGAVSAQGAAFMPILAAAHIASLGVYSITPADLTSPDAFPMLSSVTVIAGEADLAAREGATKISMARLDDPAAATLPAIASLGLTSHHLKLLNTVAVPLNAPDMSSYVAAVTKGGTDAVLLVTQGSDNARFIKTAKQEGDTTLTYVSDSSNLLRGIDQGFSSDLEGVYSVSLVKPSDDTSDPAVAKFLTEINAVNPKATKDDVAENAWAAVYLFAQIAKALPAVTAAAVQAGVTSVTDFDIGLLPPIDFSKPLTAIPGIHLFNPDVFYTRVHNGKFVPLTGQFTNLFAPAASAG